ncbi:hypothetical protein K6119_17585 [Paracrocinitomix mangrovi]|uniref:GldL-related protein n=1 Tax=Paracrocinitomix mangrovi TaxID=2862509 RepID=UPI001C8E37BD|nr:hypothetical protein [Paracrocinitomix mangrovi]UKN01538.1 hypothetical protein K6119_17585 [Paracrocinitomix mangrovi]
MLKRVYSFGVGVGLFGILFKVLHWPGAGILLVTGISLAATYWIIKAFAPQRNELEHI